MTRNGLRLAAGIFLIQFIAVGCASSPPTKKLSASDRSRLYIDMANASLTEGDPTGALQSLKTAEDNDSTIPELYLTRALAFSQKKNLKEAILNGEKALELKHDFPEAQNTLGKLYLDLGHYAKAEPILEKAADNALFRESFKANTNLGILYYRQNRIAKAEEKFQIAIQDSPTNACIAEYYLGHIRLKENNTIEAIRDYQKASARNCGKFAEAHLALGIAYEKSRKYDLARKKYLDISKGFPETKVADQALERLRYIP